MTIPSAAARILRPGAFDGVHEDEGLRLVRVLVNDGTHHIIAEVRPDQRGRGYGRVIAEAMVAQSTERGLSVIEIGCSPETSAPFWTRMGFTPVPSRRAHGGGT